MPINYLSSHEYADRLSRLANFLRSRPAFDTGRYQFNDFLWFYGDKEKFLTAVRALGAGDKEVVGTDLRFRPRHGIENVDFYVEVNRDQVCRKVQDEKWECEPLLSPEEEASLSDSTADARPVAATPEPEAPLGGLTQADLDAEAPRG
jgi:hypothetical protein